MKALLKSLVLHLQERRDSIVQHMNVQVEHYDPTYGANVQAEHIEVIDFDQLLAEIDAFSETLQ